LTPTAAAVEAVAVTNVLRTGDCPVATMMSGEEAEEEDLQWEAMIRALSLSNLAVVGGEDVSPKRRNAGHDADHGRPGPRPHLPGALGVGKTASSSTEGGLAAEEGVIRDAKGCLYFGLLFKGRRLSLPLPFCGGARGQDPRQWFQPARIGFVPNFRN